MQAFQSSVGIQQLGMSWTKVKRESEGEGGKRRSLLSLAWQDSNASNLMGNQKKKNKERQTIYSVS